MKKFLCLILSVILAVSFASSVFADVIFEPDDDFYDSHRDECVYVNRQFVVMKNESSLNKPNGKLIECRFKPNDVLNISYTYEDKNAVVWGCVDYSIALGTAAKGWIPMGSLAVEYDNESFISEFEKEMTNSPEGITLPKSDSLIFWDYPGSVNYCDIEPWDDSYIDMDFTYSYTDPNGAEWVYVGYYFGMRGWLRADDPASTDITYRLEREPVVLYPQADVDEPVQSSPLSPVWLAVILVAAVCAVTSVLLVILAKKKNN